MSRPVGPQGTRRPAYHKRSPEPIVVKSAKAFGPVAAAECRRLHRKGMTITAIAATLGARYRDVIAAIEEPDPCACFNSKPVTTAKASSTSTPPRLRGLLLGPIA